MRFTSYLPLAMAITPLPVLAQLGSASFLLTLDSGIVAHVVCPGPDSSVFVVGTRGGDLALLNISAQGALLSADYWQVSSSLPVHPLSALLDSEGKLAIMGRHQSEPYTSSFLLRYDPAARQVLWARISEQDFFSLGTIVDMPFNNAYGVCLSSFSVELLRINRQNGAVLPSPPFGYRLDSLAVPTRLVLHQGDAFVVGFHQERASANQYQGNLPFVLRAATNTGAVKWVKSTPIAPATPKTILDLRATDVVVEDNAVYSIFNGTASAPADYAPVRTYMQKHSSDGELLWVKEIQFPQQDQSYATQLFSLPDGFLIYGRHAERFIAQTNKAGELTRVFTIDLPAPFGEGLHAAAMHRGALYVTGNTSAAPTQAFLFKIDLSRPLEQTCQLVLEPAAVASVDTVQPRTPTLFVPNQPLFLLPWPTTAPTPFTPKTALLCQPNDCANLPDLTFRLDSITCTGGGAAPTYTICNNGGVEAAGFVEVWFYADNPTQDSASALGSATLSLTPPLAPGECRSGLLPNAAWLSLQGVQTVYSVVNYDNSLSTPFSLEDLPAGSVVECDYKNNLSVAALTPPKVQELNLGPDIIACEKVPAVLDAGEGYVQYVWQDGSTAQTFTATEPGLYYWVEVTDACGRIQRDSVFYTYSLLPDIRFGDTVICPGAAVSYALPGFTTYVWAPADGLDCTTCPTVTAQPAQPTVYTVLATDSLGCVLHDTFAIDFYTSALALQCPANIAVTAPVGTNSALVNYDAPALTSDCPCGAPVATLTQGLPSGASFPVGATVVCFSAEDGCATEASCCFTVQVKVASADDLPCDVKETPCLRFEILSIQRNTAGEKTYRMRLINKCPAPLVSIAYELPQGVTAVSPLQGTVYMSPNGRPYTVRNPHLAPRRSIRFTAVGAGIGQGEADIFEYTLPPQADPIFIYALARLAPQTYVETHLNVFDCVVQQTAPLTGEEADARSKAMDLSSALSVAVYPNPAVERLYVDTQGWPAEPVQIRISDRLGRLLLDDVIPIAGALHTLQLPAAWPSGIYFLAVTSPQGGRHVVRFLKE